MSVHALFRMANALFPIHSQETGAQPLPAPSQPRPEPPPPPSTQVFRPSHALYSRVSGRHEQLQKYRAAYRPPESAPASPQAD